MADTKIVSVTFYTEPKVGVPAVASVTEAPLSIWGGPIDPYPDIGLPMPQPPFPQPPIETLPDARAAWHVREDGCYFMMGPFAKPRPLGENCQLDPAKTVWTPSMNGMGWTLISGPYDKPFPIFGEDSPPVDPPVEPPVDPGSTTYSKWVYTEATGWSYVSVTTFPGGKPRPLPGQPAAK